jgi:hypothetical protein
MMGWKSPKARHGRTLAKTLCSGKKLNAISQVAKFLLHTVSKKITKNKFRPSNTLFKSAEYAITRKEHFSYLV